MMRVAVGQVVRPSGGQSGEYIDWENISSEELVALASTPSLLGEPHYYLFSNALTGERADEFLDQASVFVSSPHMFLFEEEKLLKKPIDMLEKAGAQIERAPAKKESGEIKKGFDPFNITAAFASRDKKILWLALYTALEAGEKPEAIAGLLHWKVRNLLETRAQKYSRDELKDISRQIVVLYHDSHRGAGELGVLLEKFVLSL